MGSEIFEFECSLGASLSQLFDRYRFRRKLILEDIVRRIGQNCEDSNLEEEEEEEEEF